MRWMTALMVLGLAGCAAEPPPPPPTPPERASIQNPRRPVMRARRNGSVPAPAPTPADAAPRQQEEVPAARPSEEAAAETRQERDRRAFVACRERGNDTGPQGAQTVAACLQAYGSNGVVLGD